MEPLLHDGMCRCCATEGTFKDFLTTYHWMGEEEIYADMLKDCFSISLITSEEINNGGICEICITQLRNAVSFKRQVLQTEQQFKKRLDDSMFKTNQEIKLELSHDGDTDNNLSEDYVANDFELPIKVEKEEKPKKRSARASTSKAKKSKTDEGEPSAKRVPAKRKIITIAKSSKKVPLKFVPKKKTAKLQENITTILLNTNATPIRCKGGIGYTCCFCTMQFPDPADLKIHTAKHDNSVKLDFMKGVSSYDLSVKLDITNMKCTLCDTKIPAVPDMFEHLERKHGKKCHLNAHNFIIPLKFDSESLNCAICHKEFNNFKGLMEHMNTHFRNHVCELCGAGFITRKTLKGHSYRHETGNYSCSFCNKNFTTKVRKMQHEKAIHVHMSKRNKCGFCGEKFKDYVKKNEHEVKMHGVKPVVVPCKACNKIFTNQRALTVHEKTFHLMGIITKKNKL